MRAADMSKKSQAELDKMISEWRVKLSYAYRDHYAADSKNVHERRHMKRDIARALTLKRNLSGLSHEAHEKEA